MTDKPFYIDVDDFEIIKIYTDSPAFSYKNSVLSNETLEIKYDD